MKKILVFAVILAFAAVVTAEEEFIAKLTKMQGKVMVKAKGDQSFAKAKVGTKFTADTYIQTGPKSGAELLMKSGSLVTVKESSMVLVNDFIVKKNRSKTVVGICFGKIDLTVKKLQKDDQFEVIAPAAVLGVRGTKFVVEALPDGSAVVNVDEGAVAVGNNSGEAGPTLQPGQNAGVNFVEGTVQENVDEESFADDRGRYLKENPDKVMTKMADQMETLTSDAETIGTTVTTNTFAGQAGDFQKGKNQMMAMNALTGQIYKQNKKHPGVQALYDERVKRLTDRYDEVSAMIEAKLKRIDQLYEAKSKMIDDRFNGIDKKLDGSGGLDNIDEKFNK